MSELSKICAAAREAETRRQAIWLATVVRVQGSAYRRPGARLLFSTDRVLAGSVSGGCLEASIVRKGPWLTRERAHCVRYEGGRAEDDAEGPHGTGCDGSVDILIERASFGIAGSVLDSLEGCFAKELRFALVTIFESSDPEVSVGARLTLDERGALSASVLSRPGVEALVAAAACALGERRARARTLRGPGFQAFTRGDRAGPALVRLWLGARRAASRRVCNGARPRGNGVRS